MPRTENAESSESQSLWNPPTNSNCSNCSNRSNLNRSNLNRSNLNHCDFSRSSFESSATDFTDDQGNLIDVVHDRPRSKWRIPFTSIVWPRSQASPPSARTTIQLHPRWIAIMPSKLNRSCYWTTRALRLILVLAFLFFLSTLIVAFYTDDIHHILNTWGKPGHIGYGLATWPTDFSRGINPIPCHSHNDYWRLVPLYSAIGAGCISVEADIWLFEEELYVGHSIPSLTRNRTLNSLYIDPLLDILAKQNPTTPFYNEANSYDGVFDTVPSQSLTLLIDFKTSGPELWPHVLSALQPLRERGYLTHLNGTRTIQRPITVVGTGNTPFDLVSSETSNPFLDVFFDAPLDEIYEHRGNHVSRGPVIDKSGYPRLRDSAQRRMQNQNNYTIFNSYFASVPFGKVFGHLNHDRFSDDQMKTLRGQVQAAHQRGLKARYWDLPFWPISLRNHVWDVLVKEGVDLLNVDDLEGATKRDWSEPQMSLWKWS